VTVAAINAQSAKVMFVAEGHRLASRYILQRFVRRPDD